MTDNIFDVLKERDIIAQVTHENEIRELLGKEKVTFYIGFDPTADSLHLGHFVQIMVMAHMQRAGHRPIAIVGGGTAMVGDPTGKTSMRKMLTQEDIRKNMEGIKAQLSKFIDFSDDKALMLNNGDWLLELRYIDFLKGIGVHFSVNRMLAAECFKQRLERGLNFIEFNYMLMQSYDFLKLYQEYGCRLELGGDDQWSNIIGGVELIRRVEGAEAYGMTFQLLTTSTGQKMGKTEKGALFLDPEKTSPYEFYQYLRNVDDADVVKCLKLLTFVPMDEIRRIEKLDGAEINEGKKLLAFEVTKMVHGEEEAIKAKEAAEALFSKGGSTEGMPSTSVDYELVEKGLNILDALSLTGLASSKGEGRRLIQQGGVSVSNDRISTIEHTIVPDDFTDNELIIRRGKKVYHKLILNK